MSKRANFVAEYAVLFVPFDHGTAAVKPSLMKWKRRAVWNNPGRNKMIAELAKNLVAKPKKTLRHLGVHQPEIHLPHGTRPEVVILAETAEQGRQLKKLLPDWLSLDEVPAANEHFDWEPQVTKEENTCPGKIITLVHAEMNGITCDILIRATGGFGNLDWNYVGNKKGAMPGLIVDIGDQTEHRPHLNTHIRWQEYREQGIKALEKNQLQHT